jgi:hypothetical protein
MNNNESLLVYNQIGEEDWVQVSSELSVRWRELAEQAKEKDDYKE